MPRGRALCPPWEQSGGPEGRAKLRGGPAGSEAWPSRTPAFLPFLLSFLLLFLFFFFLVTKVVVWCTRRFGRRKAAAPFPTAPGCQLRGKSNQPETGPSAATPGSRSLPFSSVYTCTEKHRRPLTGASSCKGTKCYRNNRKTAFNYVLGLIVKLRLQNLLCFMVYWCCKESPSGLMAAAHSCTAYAFKM